jgi:magnesium transporter
MMHLRRHVWPAREIISELNKRDSTLIKAETSAYFRDVYDRIFEVMDLIETTREMVSGLLDIYLSSMSNRTNEIMKVLTLVATIFIPLTFIVGLPA